MNLLGIDVNVINQCVADTYAGSNSELDDNYVFEQHYNDFKSYGHNLFPSMVVNEKIFRGRLTPDNAFEDICASFEMEPKECRAWQQSQGISLPQGQSTAISKMTLVMLIVALIVINGIIIFFYRKYY